MTTTTVACMPFSFVSAKVKASSTADGSAYFYAGHSGASHLVSNQGSFAC